MNQRPCVRRAIHALALVALLCWVLPESVEAQHASGLRLGVTIDSTSTGKASHQPVDDTSSVRARSVMRGALIGAWVGAGTGFVAAYVATHRKTVTDHSEDGLAYTFFPLLGAGLGFLVGAVIGFIRT